MTSYTLSVHVDKNEEGKRPTPVVRFDVDRAHADLRQVSHIAEYAAQAAAHQLAHVIGNVPAMAPAQVAPSFYLVVLHRPYWEGEDRIVGLFSTFDLANGARQSEIDHSVRVGDSPLSLNDFTISALTVDLAVATEAQA